ncbi:hypothetical protein L596_006534 [Steinernema carpocapsae]|uniref:Uncharacterized protein n=1 Tax=Steinernema carpocapsae TaxID=34508 RepID=A0A4U8V2L6_STECR|nr:hypothetical protein L596_006534 [Steinernema carpocapsae]
MRSLRSHQYGGPTKFACGGAIGGDRLVCVRRCSRRCVFSAFVSAALTRVRVVTMLVLVAVLVRYASLLENCTDDCTYACRRHRWMTRAIYWSMQSCEVGEMNASRMVHVVEKAEQL